MSDNTSYKVVSVDGQDPLGVAIATAPPGAPQPVVLGGNVTNWISIPGLTGNAYVTLGVGDYRYTKSGDRGVVIATNEASPDVYQWYVFHGNGPQLFYIATDSSRSSVWTHYSKGVPIRIEPFTGEVTQQFLFQPA